MTQIHPWHPNESCDLVIRHLAQGECVILPTEATYELVASALHPEAVRRLCDVASAERIPSIILGDFANLFDWLPLLSGAGPRLFRKMGAGPITLSADAGFAFGLWSRLPNEVRPLLVRDERVSVRWPFHPIWEQLRQANLPLVALPLVTEADCGAACKIDAGPTQFNALPTHVEADERRCRLGRESAVTREQVDELALCRILFVCTGNTCRSPMAEILCGKLLADHLGCAPAELPAHGYGVQSAGLAAMMGNVASPDAVHVVARLGADLTAHRSRTATMDMLAWADHVFCMTASHMEALAVGIPDLVPRLLSPAGDDVADPIGGELADYQTCANEIVQYLRQRLPEILES